MRVLIVKTSSLGDVVHMLPAVTDAKKLIPDITIDWVVEESFQVVPEWHPAVENVIPVAIRRWRRNLFSIRIFNEIRACRSILRKNEYDAIIDTQGLIKSAVITKWGRGKKYGYDRNSAREPLSAWGTDHQFFISRNLHAIDRNRQLTARALGYDYNTLPLDYGITTNFTDQPQKWALELPKDYIVALHGTSRPDKEWPESNWIELAQALEERNLGILLPWGNEREFERAKRIAEKTRATVLPQMDLNQLARIISSARSVVGMDTGLMHIAAALGKPGVALYLASDPDLTGVKTGAEAPVIHNLSNGQLSVEAVIEHLINSDRSVHRH